MGRVERFFEGIKGKRITFIGLGVSHCELVTIFAEKGALVEVCDRQPRTQLGDADTLEAQGITLHLGEDYLKHLNGDVILRTPGMRFHTPELTAARERGQVVTSELELFLDLCPCKVIGITGSDGKSTTATVVSEMLNAAGRTVHLGGNIGRALLPIVEEIHPADIAVVELSSFQLISMRRSPDIAVITNIAPNHLDMHRDMTEYVDAKRNVYRHQNAFGKTVVNMDNAITASFLQEVICRKAGFSRRTQPGCGAFLKEDGWIYMADYSGVTRLFPASDIRIPGVHNIENYLAAISAVWGLAEPEAMHQVAKDFAGVEHRIEFVRNINGARWYNDSIASSPTRTIAGLDAFDQRVILIAGGYDKQIPYLPLGPKIVEKVKTLIVMGDTAEKIAATVVSMGQYNPRTLPILRAKDMAEAVQLAAQVAAEGDVVTLSPASASFDFYRNFEARGRHFKELVNAL